MGSIPIAWVQEFRPNLEQILPVLAHIVQFFGARFYGVAFLHPSTCDVAGLVFVLWGIGTKKTTQYRLFLAKFDPILDETFLRRWQ